jgi:hypothetical protein
MSSRRSIAGGIHRVVRSIERCVASGRRGWRLGVDKIVPPRASRRRVIRPPLKSLRAH